MSLWIYICIPVAAETDHIYERNITHNLKDMAKAIGIYEHIWHPEKLKIEHVAELIEPLTLAVQFMHENPGFCKSYNPRNHWGSYDDFLQFLEEMLKTCKQFPEAVIEVSG